MHNLRDTPYVQLKIFPDPLYKKGFSIEDRMTICNFPEKIAQSKYICVRSWNISSLLDISCALDFWEVLEIVLK